MAATTEIREAHGSGPTLTAVTNVRFCNSDTANDTSNPIQIPASGNAYSFVKSLKLACTTSPAGTINNVKHYWDGTNNFGTGITLKGHTTATYTQATSNSVDSSAYTTGTEVFANWTSASPLSVSGSISNPSTGNISDYVRLQMQVASTATVGTTPQETGTFRYDET